MPRYGRKWAQRPGKGRAKSLMGKNILILPPRCLIIIMLRG
jgi:hypothetical protein